MSGKQRAAMGLKRRIIGQLKEIGIDVDAVLANDASAQATAVHALKAVKKAMDRPKPWPTSPTQERRDKGQKFVAIEVNPGQPKAHVAQWPVDQIARRLSLAEYSAAERYREAFEVRHRSAGVSSYGQSSGGGFSKGRLELTERQQMAGQEIDAIRRVLVGPLEQVARNFILERPIEGSDRVLSFVEYGRQWFGVTDENAARVLAQGQLKAVCAVINEALADLDLVRRKEKIARRAAG